VPVSNFGPHPHIHVYALLGYPNIIFIFLQANNMLSIPFRMQYEAAIKIGDNKVGFLDPQKFCQKTHDEPLRLPDDNEAFANCKTKAQRDAKRKELHKRSKQKVATYITNCLRFFEETGKDHICAPYLFKYVNKST